MGEWRIIQRALLVVPLALGSGCAALSDALPEAQSNLSSPIIAVMNPPSAALPAAEGQAEPDLAPAIVSVEPTDTSSDPDSLVVAAEAPADPLNAQDKGALKGPDELYDPFADQIEGEDYDPWEGFNSVMFEFNRTVDKYALKPVAKVYNKVMPDSLQKGINNFFHNIRFGPRLINNIFQAKAKGAGIELSRFLINSTIGIAGFFDAARNLFELTTPDEDSGQTMGVYGIPAGPYLVLPLLPPLNLRDLFGMVFDFALDPVNYFVMPTFEVDDWPSLIAHKNRDTTTIAQFATRAEFLVNDRSLNLEAYEGVEEATVDLYSAVRNAYLQKRARMIRE